MSDSQLLPTGQKKINHLEMIEISKFFPGVIANNRVNFDVKAGEVHALLGENGAGKSTLMKVLYGLYPPEEGAIKLDGEQVVIGSPVDSIGLGIGMIHQHFMLVESLTVAENVALGLASTRGPLTDLDIVSQRIQELSEIYGLQVDPKALIWQLSVGQQQRVEIIKALYRGAALLILDEPTAVLTPQEVDEFFLTMRKMMDDGHALIFISHKLHEVLDISHRISVLRDGHMIGTIPVEGATKEKLAEMMVGREIGLKKERVSNEKSEKKLILKNISAQSDRGTPALKGIDLEVYSGEILGVAGVSGNGQKELAEVITGLRNVTSGQVVLEDEDVTGLSPKELINRSLSYIPEERMRDGMIKEFTVAENLILREYDQLPFANNGFLNLKNISTHSDEMIKSFNVKTPSQETTVKSLSGGNIQKLVLARELFRKPRTLIAAQPTRGLDIGAMEYVHLRLLEQREEGTATILISEDLDEILALSDRIAVIFEGEIMGIIDREEATTERLGLMMAGVVE
ncbi:MAG: ABC transporter ATP-binding protein [Chloroflexi bacterium]|jgi:general nucleoside transport system ATP-binding protein|nr:ABC transporter ATP-binding protein [Chloroflexota bacterium]MBT4002341.1 ABC transporter ATP-binding protein [Chloroflexota bacterium]MBT4306637.1 ABC transporter ATP-binding protein [Chloroflexota bacterium]MBT4533777.1 ABC transporter ATP-binding protein [Chloroflexota bacterium]MBT4681577.1 ABC transporter ATP-binding protein [Chloroflexota bacterium]